MLNMLWRIFVCFLITSNGLLLLSGCKEEAKTINQPSIYLLNHKHWTNSLVLNFTDAIAPSDNAIGQPLASDVAPKLQPEIAGSWHWDDPSRLVFLPTSQTIAPDLALSISLEKLAINSGYRLRNKQLNYQTPSLKLVRHACTWQDSVDAPLRRNLDFLVEFNYPLDGASFNAAMNNGTKIKMSSAKGYLFSAKSDQLLRPAEDTGINATLDSGKVILLKNDYKDPSIVVNLSQSAQCQLPLIRADWDKFDKAQKATPTVTDITASQQNAKLNVVLVGDALTESAKKTNAGQPVKDGVTIKPAVEGSWQYGESASGADLIFTPKTPELLEPGETYQITVDKNAFATLEFAKPEYQISVEMPQMQSSISDLQLYSDPQTHEVKRATATLHFTYAPSRDQLSAHTSASLTPYNSPGQELGYTLNYDDKDPLLAFLKTDPIQIGKARSLLRIDLGSITAAFGGKAAVATYNTLEIPSAQDYFNVSDLNVQTVVKADGDLQRLVIVQTNVAVKNPMDLEAGTEIYVLPDCRIKNTDRPEVCAKKDVTDLWMDQEQVDADVLKVSTPITGLKWQDSGSDDKTVQHISFSAPEKTQLFVKVNKGLASIDGFNLHKDARFLKEITANQRELKILHDGSLLSLSGDKKLGVTTRGVNNVQVELQRVVPHNMHHLTYFSSGSFQKPTFKLPIEHFAEKITYDETLPAGKEMERQYFSVDFGKFTNSKGFPPRGLFMLSVAEKKTTEEQKLCEESDGSDATVVDESEQDSDSSESADGETEAEDGADDSKTHCLSNDKRLVLLTDMGLLVKTALNGEQTVFVMSFRTGLPVADAQVSLLGKNGVALSAGKTDSQGKVNFPTTDGLTAEKTPTVYLAEKDGDLSFLPFKRDNRQLDVSRFDIDGLHDSADSLQAYLFSDRGIYRPGDTVKVGVMLRKRDWTALPAGLPLKLRIKDPENQEVWNHVATFGTEGVTEISWPSPSAGKTGKYQVELFVADKSEKSLGVTTVRVEEFQPDRLQVKTDILAAPAKGWIRPEAVKAKVTVRNLFGTAAAGNTAKVELMIHPWSGQIPGYDNYSFRRTLPENIPSMPQTLGDVTTNDQGEALFDLPLASISEPVYQIAVAGEGFEKGAGRSVVNTTTALVSKQDYLLGYKADGSLDYLSKDTKRSLNLLAVGADFQPRQSETVSAEIYENRYVSTLVKRKDGLYQYQSVLRQELRDTQPVSLIKGTADFNLPSANAGDFYVLFKNNQGQELNRVNYTVAGDGNVTRNIERNAELKLRLNKKEYQPGETIDMQIVAPYHGAGLITVEQDGVLTSQWFKTDTTATSQQISLPNNISGNAYVSVAFVRSLDSKEIYMSPLSYGVVPISISKQAYTQQLQLNAPKTVQSGQAINVNYSVTEPTKLVLYAVDEGILQFAHYSNPTPLEYFFRKRALQVTSHQILDLILPDFSLVQRLSDPGGDETGELMGKYKNPFARKHKPPMTFWSGFIDAQPGEHTVSIPVPEYFNGSIRVIAVAVNAGKMGVATAQTTATQDYVIQPQQPYVVAPGDEFDMGVLVANASAGAKAQDVKVSVVAGDALELLSPNPQSLSLAPAKDGTVRFHAKVKEKLGPINVRYQVTDASGKTVGYNEEMSIRPSQPLLTSLQGGVLTIEQQKKGKVQALDLQRTLYDEQRKAELAVSITPAAYLRGIMEFLKSYPYGCTEQITSQAFPAAVLGANPELGLNAEDVDKLVQRSVHILQTRQKHDGSFGYWSVADAGNADYSMYATHFLLEAKEHGFNLPANMLERAMQYADEYAQITPTTSPEAYDEARAYAFYLLARNGSNIAERLRAFEAELKARPVVGLEGLRYRAGFFLAAAYKLHHLDDDSDRLLSGFRKQWQTTGLLPQDMQNNPEMLSLYLYLIGKHMPEQIDSKDPKFGKYLLELAQDLVKQRMNSFRGSLALLGLGSLWERFDLDKQSSFSVFAGTPMAQLPLQGKTSKSALLSPSTRPLEIRGQGLWNLYYQLSESGYDRAAPAKEIAEKLTINRSLLNEKGDKIQQISLQDKLHIRIALHPDQEMKDVAVVLLVPGGFEIDLGESGLAERKSLPITDKPLWEPDYIDVQEDRLVMFGGFDGSEKYFEFKLKPLNTGVYKVPSVFAEGMYDSEIQYRGLADEVRVVE